MKASPINEIDATITSVKIDDTYEISKEWWELISINWDINSPVVSGTMTFMDVLDFSQSAKLGEQNTLHLKFKDAIENEFKYVFAITDVVKEQPRNIRKVTLRFIDVLSQDAAQTYKAKGYKDKTSKEIAQDIYENFLSDEYSQYKQNILQDGNHYSTYVLNGNKNLSKNLKELYDTQGLIYFKTRDKINVMYPHDIFKNEPKEQIYSVQAENTDYFYIIDEWDYSSSMRLDQKMPETKKNWFTPFDKQLQVIDFDYDNANNKFTVSDGKEYVTEELYNLDGSEDSALNYVNPSQRLLKEYIMDKTINTNEITIFVNGDFSNNLGDILNLNMLSSTGDLDDIDEKLDGNWIITNITDHIGVSFFQIITLKRPLDMVGKPIQ